MRSRHPEFRSVASLIPITCRWLFRSLASLIDEWRVSFRLLHRECHESQGGRGQSGDTLPYSPAREVDDIAALIKAAGGSASLVGLSSGGALALEAAASGLPVNSAVAYEPPYVDDDGQVGGAAHEGNLKRLLAAGNRAEAVKYFMRDMVGAPAPLVVIMRLLPWIWRKLEAVAHTLPYDAVVMTAFKIPRARFASVGVPVLVMNGAKTDPRLRSAARTIAEIIPAANYRELAKQTHNVQPDVLTPAVGEFVEAASMVTSRRAG
jgi:pimeloyl-ACP methyl ester carboxylesterase